MLGQSTFGLSMWLLKWLPVRLVDRFLLIVSRLMLGDTARFGLERPELGPLELKNLSGKTPVLDVGTLAKIKSGDIKVLSQLYHVSYNEHITSSLFILLSVASYVCLKWILLCGTIGPFAFFFYLIWGIRTSLRPSQLISRLTKHPASLVGK
jgi:hypothetical protein